MEPNATRDQRTLRGEATRARLLDEAMRLFAERGYEGVSTRALAAAAESNVALITFHFGSKRGLYNAALAAVEQRLAEVMTPAVESLRHALAEYEKEPVRLMDCIRLLLQGILIRLLPATPTPGFFQLLSREMHEQDGFSDKLWNLFIPVMECLEKALTRATTTETRERQDFRDKTRLASFLLIDSVLGIVRDYPMFSPHLGGKGNRKSDAAMLADLMWGGMAAAFAFATADSPAQNDCRSTPC